MAEGVRALDAEQDGGCISGSGLREFRDGVDDDGAGRSGLSLDPGELGFDGIPRAPP